MSIFKYSAAKLYEWLTTRQEMVVLDVRNKVDFGRFKIEAPYPFDLQNISYFDFMEIEDECVVQLPKDKPIRVVCAKEGSAKYVAELLEKNGFQDIGYLEGGIPSWGNLLIPELLNPGQDYQLFQFIRPGKASCSYGLIYGKEMMLFDPSRNIDFYIEFAAARNCTITHTFETHLQADYIAGSRMLAEKLNAEFLANDNDFKDADFDYTSLKDKEQVSFSHGGPHVTALFTPGHTPGSTSYFIDETYLITGDTIFIQSIGRPDLGGQVDSWSDTLFVTLQKIKSLDPQLFVLPGHYMDWQEANNDLAFVATLREAREYNRSIYDIDNKNRFLEFIKSNMRQQPEEYGTIRRINANLEQVDDKQAEILDLGKNECAASAYNAQSQKQ